MKYRIYRTSDYWGTKKQPCDIAYKEGDEWHIDIDSLEELDKLVDEVNSEIIIGYGWIEIYDDYRE